MDTLLIDEENWDLCVDSSRHIAIASNPYALAQGASCAIKAFLGENYYNTELGVPYYELILGKTPPLSLVKSQLVAAALTVPEVVVARVYITSFIDGVFSGQVQVADVTGAITVAGF